MLYTYVKMFEKYLMDVFLLLLTLTPVSASPEVSGRLS